MLPSPSVRPDDDVRFASMDGRLSRIPVWLAPGARRWSARLAGLFGAPPVAGAGVRPSPSAEADQVADYLAQAGAIVGETRRAFGESGGPVQPDHIHAMSPLKPGGASPVTASEAMIVLLAAGALDAWRARRVASQAVGEIVMTLQRVAQAARRDRPAHRVYVLVHEEGGQGLVALNLEACRRPAEAVLEARERVQLVDALRRRFSAETVARAALLGGEPSLILDSQLAAEPRRRTLFPEEQAAA